MRELLLMTVVIPFPALFCSETCFNEYQAARRMNETVRKVQIQEAKCSSSYGIDLIVKAFLELYEVFDKSIEAMEEFLDNHTTEDYTICDFDMRRLDDFKKSMLLVLMSSVRTERELTMEGQGTVREFLMENDQMDSSDYIMEIFENNEDHRDFIDDVLAKLASATSWYITLTIKTDIHCSLGSFFHPALLMLNYSCDPNITIQVFFGKKMVWIANRPIKAGSQIFHAYVNAYYESVQRYCNYTKNCVPCKNGWSDLIDHAQIEAAVIAKLRRYLDNFQKDPALVSDNLIDLLAQCGESISKMFDDEYYSNPSKREAIATKLLEFKEISNLLSDPFHLDISKAIQSANLQDE